MHRNSYEHKALLF